MKILIVNTFDNNGGAARAAHRLHGALLEEGIESSMLVQKKGTVDSNIKGPSTKIQKGLALVRPTLDSVPLRFYPNRTSTPFSPAWVPFAPIVDQINDFNPDIVHLHWVTLGMLRIEDVSKIRAPIVWSLHDMWPFTGGCHYNEGCMEFTHNCGKCKVLQSKKSLDLSRNIHNRKKRTFQAKKDIIFVGLSRWLANEAANSSLISHRQVVNLPNPINVKTFSPFDKSSARTLLGLPQDKKLVLFGAMNATSDPRKGYQQLIESLNKLNIPDAELVVFGANKPEQGIEFPQRAHYLGQLHDDVTLRVLYNAADVMIVPSIQENLSNAIMESLACGTPVVGFDIGGNSDLIEHEVNGYLASPVSSSDLAHGIEWVLTHRDYVMLTLNARKKVIENFENSMVARKYIDLYCSVMEKESL